MAISEAIDTNAPEILQTKSRLDRRVIWPLPLAQAIIIFFHYPILLVN
jgi:hypothetical protein